MAKVFITGSSDGLGLMAARILILQGLRVVLHGRNPVRAQAALVAAPGAEHAVIGDLADLERLEREHPEFLSPHVYPAEHDERVGDDRAFLREEDIAAQPTSNASRAAVLAAARRGLAIGGHRGMLRAMLEAQTKLFEAGTGDALDLARLAALLGDRKAALADLSLAVDRGEADFSEKSVGGPFAFLAGDPTYQRLVARLRAGG